MPVRNILISVLVASIAGITGLLSACGEDSGDATPPATSMPAVQSLVASVSSSPPQAQIQPSTPIPSVQSAPTRTAPAPQSSPTFQTLPEISVVATSNIVGNWVKRVGGERVNFFPLLPPAADPHTFQPGARDIATVADADMIFSVGLSLEASWLDELIENAARDHDAIISLGELAEPIEFIDIFDGEGKHEEEGEDHEGEDGHIHSDLDPHFWFDPLRVQGAVNEITARLSALDPGGAGYYLSNATLYNRELAELHSWIQERVATIPEDDRILVTSHDSFQYFAGRYGFEVVGAIFPTTTEAEPTAQDLAKLVETIEHEGARVVFTENIHSSRLAQRIAEETGVTLIGSLYTGSLGEPGGEAGTYTDMMRYNVGTIVEALK